MRCKLHGGGCRARGKLQAIAWREREIAGWYFGAWRHWATGLARRRHCLKTPMHARARARTHTHIHTQQHFLEVQYKKRKVHSHKVQ